MYFYFFLFVFLIYIFNNPIIIYLIKYLYEMYILETYIYQHIIVEDVNFIKIYYIDHFKLYTILIRKDINNSGIIQIYDSNYRMVYRYLRPYLGPFNNFYTISYEIKDFFPKSNPSELEFHYTNGNISVTQNIIKYY